MQCKTISGSSAQCQDSCPFIDSYLVLETKINPIRSHQTWQRNAIQYGEITLTVLRYKQRAESLEDSAEELQYCKNRSIVRKKSTSLKICFFYWCCKYSVHHSFSWNIFHILDNALLYIFHWICPMDQFSHRVTMSVCLYVCLWQFKIPASRGCGDLWSKGLSLILACNDTILVLFRFNNFSCFSTFDRISR